MRILYCGNFQPAHSTENHVAATLEDMGHEVVRLQENELRDRDLFQRTQEVGPDLVLWTRTWPGYVTQTDINAIRDSGVKTVSFHLDLYMGISREKKVANDPFWRTDYVFTPDGDPESAQKFAALGINHYYLPAAVWSKEVGFGTPRQEYACDVAFIGSVWQYHPEWPYREELYKFLRDTYGKRFRVYGHPYESVRGLDLNDALASAKVVIGDSLVPNYTHQNYWSDRLYETTGRGGFTIFPMIRGLETQFNLDTELVTYRFGDFDELQSLIDFFVGNEDMRNHFRNKAVARVIKNHTYHHRMEKLLEIVND